MLSDHVHQATGMVAEQLDCSIAEALERLVAIAEARGDDLELVALDVLDRVLRLTGAQPLDDRGRKEA